MVKTGKIVTLKDSNNSYMFPETSSQGVYMNDGKTLEEATNEFLYFEEDQDIVQLQTPQMVEKVNNIESELKSVTFQLDTKTDTYTTQNIQSQINNLVIKGDGTQNLEVVQARGEFPVLNDRINNFDRKIYDILEENKKEIPLTAITDKRLAINGTVEAQSGWCYFETDVVPGELYYLDIYAYSITNPFLAFHNENGDVIETVKGVNTGWNLLEGFKIMVPLNCNKMLFATSASNTHMSTVTLKKVINYGVKNMKSILNDIDSFKTTVENSFEEISVTWNEGKMYNRNTGIIEALTNCNCVSINVSEGEVYNIKTTGYAQANPYIILNTNEKK